MSLSAKREVLARIHGRYQRAGRPHKVAHPRGVLRHLRVSLQIRSAVVEPSAAQEAGQAERADNHLRSGGGAAGAQACVAGERSVVQQAAQGGTA